MASFDTVDLLDGNVFQVTWDLGRRCNYDCSYCPAHRHDNFSPHASLEDLIKNSDFVLKYIDLYMTYRDYKRASISFTGGEPTVNPNFIPFIKYLKDTYNEKYKHRYECSFALTSNGAMSEKMATQVMENLDHITISYHAEADDRLKNQVKDRMVQFHTYGPQHKCTMSINVMFHAGYFGECIKVCEFLDEHDIKYVPRIIGEEPDSKSNFAHMYTKEQTQWFKDYWTNNTKKVQEA
jgi:sulfatase maturation enzyme AslB (radical SAM superfamily)